MPTAVRAEEVCSPIEGEEPYTTCLDPALGPSGSTPEVETASLSRFPYCVCKDYRCIASPYRLEFAGTKTLAGGNVDVCFSVQRVSKCGQGCQCQ